jgi:hypothetical protein
MEVHMSAGREKTEKNIGVDATVATKGNLRKTKIDREAPAGGEESLGAESVRDGRPATDDSIVEAKDEEGPGPV